MRQTSLLAYEELKEDKILGERQRIVFDLIKRFPDRTAVELTYFSDHTDPNYIRPRINELLKMGLVIESGKRKCRYSNKEAYTWRVK